jgi:electron transfer flavoprotein alpha subunit
VIAVLPVRDGITPAGTEAICECDRRALVVGEGAELAADDLAKAHSLRELSVLELPGFRPGLWARELAPHLSDRGTIVLPATPDGRDLAPRLAAELKRPLLACALRVVETDAWLVRHQGRQVVHQRCSQPFVATLLTRSGAEVRRAGGISPDSVTPTVLQAAVGDDGSVPTEVTSVSVLEADPSTMDLVEAARIFAAGAGVGTPRAIADLEAVAAAYGASVGATRVVTDAGLVGHERQIGTTGVAVRPRCYVAFGVSGAAQHLAGLGSPDHVISINLDRSCPMMAIADLALVTDAAELLAVLASRLVAPQPDGHDA